MSEWDNLVSFSDWAGKLQSLIVEGQDELDAGRNGAGVQTRMGEFRMKVSTGSRDLDRKLRKLAKEAVDDITRTMADRTLTDLASRKQKLADLTATVLKAASIAEAKAKVLNLTDASTLVASVSTALSAFEGMKVDDILNSFVDADAIRAEAESTIQALRSLKTMMEQADTL